MGQLKYKGYAGSVEYNEEDNCLFGKVLGLKKDCITYEGETISELKSDFEGLLTTIWQVAKIVEWSQVNRIVEKLVLRSLPTCTEW